MNKINCSYKKISPDDGFHYFFGYYDKCPWNRDETKVLAHRSKFIDHFPEPEDEVEVGYIDLEKQQFITLDTTTAWNWQQGAQLQWIQHEDKEKVIFNIRVKDDIICKIMDIEDCNSNILCDSIYAISPQGDIALTLNYARLYDMRKDYGIAGLDDPNNNIECPDSDGIFLVDLKKNTSRLLLSINEIAEFQYNIMGKNVKHKINHLMFNPAGTRFCFLHRFKGTDGITHSRFFSADADGKNLRLLFDGMVSHYGWQDNETIIAWAGKRKLLGQQKKNKNNFLSLLRKTLKPIYYALGKPRILMQKIVGDSYWLLDDSALMQHRQIGLGKLTCDGHCTALPQGRWFITDGYTDSKNRLPLFLWDEKIGDVVELGRFMTPKSLDQELRVDLHPRSNHEGNLICIDSAMDGSRGIYIVNISDIIAK